MGREWECNLWVYEANRGSFGQRVGVEYSSAIWRPERFWNKKRWGAKGNPRISKTIKVPCRMRDALRVPDFLSPCLGTLANKQEWFQRRRSQGIWNFLQYTKTFRERGKEREYVRFKKKKSPNLNAELFLLSSKEDFFFNLNCCRC